MAKETKRKLPLMTDFLLMLLLSILLFSTIATSSAEQDNLNQEIMLEVEKATEFINSSQILRLWQNESTRIGVGTVQNVICKYDESGAIKTYADISVDVPLTDNLNSKQTITLKYPGGRVGDKAMKVTINWAGFPNDKIVPPQEFKLSKGMSIMFFEQQNNGYLVGYIPYSTAITDQMTSKALLSDPLPTTLVPESAGYGFAWTDGVHMHWSDLPRSYYIDEDGTADIEEYYEFGAISAAFNTWEYAPHCGLDFTYGGTYDYDNYEDYDQPADGYSVVVWVLDYPTSAEAAKNFWKLEQDNGLWHVVENDIVLNDNDKHWVIGDPVWWWECDVQSIVTHEIGHTVGLQDLKDSSNYWQTMWHNYADRRDISWRSLEWGDLNGAHYLLPAHNDAGSGGDGSNTFSGATTIQRNVGYEARLCDLPDPSHSVDTQDYFKFYAPAGMWVSITLYPPPNADFDLELYNPSGSLVAYSRNTGNGVDEQINRNPMGTSGYWAVRIYTTKTDSQGDGQYSFRIHDYLSAYVSSIAWAGWISGYGGAWNPNGMIGSSPDGNYAAVYGYYPGDAGAICGYMSTQRSGTSNIYIYGYCPLGYNVNVMVYVSQNNYYDWYYVGGKLVYGSSSPHTIHFGTTTQTFRYVAVVCYIYNDPGCLYIDCLIATN